MDLEALTLIAVSSLACCAAVGGCLARLKHRNPLEGFVLGACLGPIGVLLELRQPFAHRPMVDRGAWNSFRSVVDYQSDSKLLQLTHAAGRSVGER